MAQRSTTPAARTVAPGIHRVGDAMVNLYLVEDGHHVTVVDAGLPGMYDQLRRALDEIGRPVSDVRAVLVTHGHPDHTGLAERLRTEAGASVWVHERDLPIVADPRHIKEHWKAERSMLPYVLRRPAVLRTPLHMARTGGFRPPPVRELEAFVDGQQLDVPGRPQAFGVPGHTAGSAAFVFADRGVIFTGDALVTRDDIVGCSGPRTVARAFTQDAERGLASLDVLQTLNAPLVLTGHGEPYEQGIAAAVDAARAAGVS